MWIVRLALRRPYTFVVFAMLVVIVGVLSILRMPTDVFPEINIPVLSVIYNFAGMPADEMESRIVTQFERFAVTIVKDVEHIESQSLTGVGVVKIYFQPGANIEEAMASVVATAQTGLRLMPPGTQPPIILRYSASSVPILQLSIHSETIPEQQLFDITINQLRTQLITGRRRAPCSPAPGWPAPTATSSWPTPCSTPSSPTWPACLQMMPGHRMML